jgi:Cdc6-like AAA superfamily ATPase
VLTFRSKLSQAISDDITTLSNDTKTIKDDTAAIRNGFPHVEATIVAVRSQQISEQHRQVMSWLSLADFSAQQHDIIRRREEGTGQWFLESTQFREWRDNTGTTLFCPGIPGAGKTMIAGVAVQHLSTTFPSDDKIGVAYVYCNYKDQGSQNALNLLSALLKQLLLSRPNFAESIYDIYNDHNRQQSRPSLDEMCTILRSTCALFSKVFLVVDALDECTNRDGERTSLINQLWDIQEEPNVNVLVTSRFIPDIEQKYISASKLEIRASDHDIKCFVASQILSLPNCIQNDYALKTDVQTRITERSDGM